MLVAAGCGWNRTQGGTPAPAGKSTASRAGVETVDIEGLRPQVQAFCGDCHVVPPASSFKKEDWPGEVALGYELYHLSGRFDLHEPPEPSVVAYFQALAPDELKFAKPEVATHALRVRFRQQAFERPERSAMAAVAAFSWQPPSESSPGKLLFSDMHYGSVSEIRFADGVPKVSELGNLRHPSIIEPTDLDGNGISDYLVGDLGSFLPEDHDQGRVLWLHRELTGGWEVKELAKGLGRVAQAVSGDFDGDGALDVLVAEFGWRTTGRILLLKREGDPGGAPRFEQVVVDPRHGTSNLRVLDWEGDGDLDFVALVTQEHEKVELFLNAGDGKFRIELLFAASDPAFGSSDIELADIDGDGDLDVLHTNGDSLDTASLKPYHAVRWLENEGRFPFTSHEITQLPGAFKAVAADIDGDGDLDIAATAFPLGTNFQEISSFDHLVVLEQTAPGQFARHSLHAPHGGVSLAAADFDGDGDVDLITGAFDKEAGNAWVTVWWNEGQSGAMPSAAR